MVASRCVLFAGLTAFASASVLVAEEQMFNALLKRQQPGTPLYNCHDNCGTAITVSKAGGDTCKDEVFLFDYENCLKCAGPDNDNIWRYYGGSLTPVAEKCGLPTAPLSGEQADVPEAMHPGGSSEPTPTPTPTPTPAPSSDAPEPTSDAPEPTSDAPEPTSDAVAPTTGASAPVTPTPSATTVEPSEYASETFVSSPTLTDAIITAPTVTDPSATGILSPSSNGTASFTVSAPPEQTENAGAHLDIGNGVVGAIVFGLVYGLGI
ncbi:hypothetical protein P154DRAFT_526847 [Amniculicola lignicola CBS 123094]|uniref:Uncharacterized protein n=1 Tax=Amniculicola lignicola CBS 123094 TaxID=1392246 RepID=A0A6A5VYG3_9PLEO|nr:hypothetical protein P154DRAFT_526847 [Amniculicola lignicola CBS 123094]